MAALTLNANGSFTYTPNANFNGTDTFTYRANDGTGNSNLATVTITVNPTGNAPVARDNTYSVTEDMTLTVSGVGVLGNDTDADGDPLTAVLVSTTTNGTLTLNAAGSFTYTPNANYIGIDTFTYRANDGSGNSNLATVTINVTANGAPIGVNDVYSVNQGGVLTVAANGVLANDVDIAGDPITATLVTVPTNGLLILRADGSFTYTPRPDFSGIDSFSYRPDDGMRAGNITMVTISVEVIAAPPLPSPITDNSRRTTEPNPDQQPPTPDDTPVAEVPLPTPRVAKSPVPGRMTGGTPTDREAPPGTSLLVESRLAIARSMVATGTSERRGPTSPHADNTNSPRQSALKGASTHSSDLLLVQRAWRVVAGVWMSSRKTPTSIS